MTIAFDKCIQQQGRRLMKFIDDLAGAIRDVARWILWGFSYFVAGILLVGVPLYVIVFLFEWFT